MGSQQGALQGALVWSSCIVDAKANASRVDDVRVTAVNDVSIDVQWRLTCSGRAGVVTGFIVTHCPLAPHSWPIDDVAAVSFPYLFIFFLVKEVGLKWAIADLNSPKTVRFGVMLQTEEDLPCVAPPVEMFVPDADARLLNIPELQEDTSYKITVAVQTRSGSRGPAGLPLYSRTVQTRNSATLIDSIQ